jgi:LysR family nod box-dependent transcriptional activator
VTDLRRVDVNLIVVLDAILQEKNLTRAGELIGMTQPAVSGALARLRQQFDDPILVRSARTFELTPKAIELQPIVREAMIEISRTLDLLPTFDPLVSTRTFLISASDYVLAQMTSPLLSVFAREAPGASVEFDALPGTSVISANDLLRRDVMISGTGRGVPGKRQSLFSDRFVCIVDAQNPRLRDGRLSVSDLQDLRHVNVSFGGVHTHIDDMLSAGGIVPRIGVVVQGFMPVLFQVSASPMVGWVPERLALQYRELLGLAIAETPLAAATLVEAAHWHPSKTGDPALVWLLAMLRKAAELVEFGIGGIEGIDGGADSPP